VSYYPDHDDNGLSSCEGSGSTLDDAFYAIAQQCDRHDLPAHDPFLAVEILLGEAPLVTDWGLVRKMRGRFA